MNQDEVIEMAVKAGMNREVLTLGRNVELLEAFAKLVAQHEREACAKVADEYTKASYLGAVGAAIRARGQE